LSKQFGTEALEPLLGAASGDEPPALIIVPTLDEVIGSGDLRPRFQPIVSLADRSLHGVESLARYRGGEPFDRPDLLFSYATRRKDVARLEAACIAMTMRAAVTFPESTRLFLNIHPAALDDVGIVATLATSARQSGIDLARVVLEITEQQELRHTPSLFGAIEQLRALGVRFAFDDVGVAYSHLPLIETIRPSYLKISQLFGTQFESDPTKVKIIRNIVGLGVEFDCDVIIEGIEDASSESAARDLGIKFGQGYLFGRPADAP
jgi:EAL domain-containing protein (putative c-di-GMP-specific phosphodiesterase class I)